MSKRLWYIITWPSAILATLFAVWLLILLPEWLKQPWMHVKLGFVIALFVYQIKTHIYFKALQNDIIIKSSNYMRIWNEGATFILFAVVFCNLKECTKLDFWTGHFNNIRSFNYVSI